jgi:hypothetical protein
LSNWDTDFAEICHTFMSFSIHCHFPYKRPNQPLTSKMVLHWSSSTILHNFCKFCLYNLWRDKSEDSQSSTKFSPNLN